MNRTQKQSGFTLVELAIVLVIIGLIVGGVLVGQDLIRAATIRSAVTDIEKYNAAATTFRGKYEGLPGDMLNTKAVQFGFNTATGDVQRDGSAGRGDGNGQVSGCTTATSTNLGCETLLIWSDLSAAKMIPARSSVTSVSAITVFDSKSSSELADGLLPKTRLRDTALVDVFTFQGKNYYAISEVSTTDSDGAVALASAVTPLEAGGIDSKLDDGEPLSGTITAITAPGTLATAAAATGDAGCVGTAADGNHYNTVTDVLAGTVACSLSIRSSF